MSLCNLPSDSNTHTMLVAVICSTPDPKKVVDEMYLVPKRGDILGLSSWLGAMGEGSQAAIERA